MTEIIAGYQVVFHTWENDGAARTDQAWYGIQTEADVRFLIDLADQFQSKNTSQCAGLGNSSPTVYLLLETVEKVVTAHPDVSWDMRKVFADELDEAEGEELRCERIYSLLCDRILNHPVDSFYNEEYERFCRVCDGVTVYYFPQPIEDVTYRFT